MESEVKKLHWRMIRFLDVDDLLILKMIGDGLTFGDIAKEMLVTPTAITFRVKRYHQIIPEYKVDFKRCKKIPNAVAKKWGKISKEVLTILDWRENVENT